MPAELPGPGELGTGLSERGESVVREAVACEHAVDDRWDLTFALETRA